MVHLERKQRGSVGKESETLRSEDGALWDASLQLKQTSDQISTLSNNSLVFVTVKSVQVVDL